MSSSAGRKNLIKLIKIIHPDVLASCGHQTAFKVAQKVNLACIQNFQQLWDSFDSILSKSAMNSNHAQLIAIRKPLEKSYDLTFYFTSSSSSAEISACPSPSPSPSTSSIPAKTLYKVPYALKTPLIFTKANESIPFKDAHLAAKMILKHHDSIYAAAGLPTNWLSIIPGFDSDQKEKREKDSAGVYDEEDVLTRLERLYFDKVVTSNARWRKLQSLGLKDFSSSFQFKLPSSNPSGHLEQEINYYLKNGNLRFHQVALEDEVDAVRRMKEFLLNFGVILKFRLLDWHEVVFFVLSGRSDPPVPTKIGSSSSGSGVSSIIPAREDYKVHVMTHKGKQYQVETFRSGPSPSPSLSGDISERKQIKERFVVTVPLRFRDGAMLELIRVGLGRVANFVISDFPDMSQEGD